MKRIILFAARHPWPLLLVILAVSIAAASQLGQLRFNISAQSMMIDEGVDAEIYQRTLDTFGSENVTILFLSDDQLFDPGKLERIRQAIDAIAALPFVSRTESVTLT